MNHTMQRDLHPTQGDGAERVTCVNAQHCVRGWPDRTACGRRLLHANTKGRYPIPGDPLLSVFGSLSGPGQESFR